MHHVSRIHGCVVLEKATRNSSPQWRNLTRCPVLSYSVDRSTSEQAVMQTFVRKTFLLSRVETKQTAQTDARSGPPDAVVVCGPPSQISAITPASPEARLGARLITRCWVDGVLLYIMLQ